MRFLPALCLILVMALPSRAEASGPALWHVSDEDTSIHILGSVHVLKPGTVWLDDDIQAIVSQADGLYLELSAEDQTPQVMQPLVMKYGMLPEGDHLKNHVPEDLYAELSAELTTLGMTEAQFGRFKPWMATTVYATFKFIKLGFTPQAGVEATIVSLANARGVPVLGLETAEFQISLFDNFTDETELAFLEQTLAGRDELVSIMETITAYWTAGDMDGLASTFDEAFAEYPELEETILTARNENWVTSVYDILKKPGNYFIVVGAGHLAGDKSLIALLEKSGKRVLRLR